MIKSKILKQIKLNGYQRYNNDVELKVVGLFDSVKVHWTYYLVSFVSANGSDYLTNELKDINSPTGNFTVDNIRVFGIKFDSPEDAEKYMLDFEVKWRTGSNNTMQEVRDQKLKELL